MSDTLGKLAYLGMGKVNADLAEIEATKASTSYVDSQISTIGDATPKDVYATVELLEAAFPTGTTGIYIVGADWYYWNTTAWTNGGVYQATGESVDSRTSQNGTVYEGVGEALREETDVDRSRRVKFIDTGGISYNADFIKEASLNTNKDTFRYRYMAPIASYHAGSVTISNNLVGFEQKHLQVHLSSEDNNDCLINLVLLNNKYNFNIGTPTTIEEGIELNSDNNYSAVVDIFFQDSKYDQFLSDLDLPCVLTLTNTFVSPNYVNIDPRTILISVVDMGESTEYHNLKNVSYAKYAGASKFAKQAKRSDHADTADTADNATHATNSNHADTADNATHATNSDNSISSDKALIAEALSSSNYVKYGEVYGSYNGVDGAAPFVTSDMTGMTYTVELSQGYSGWFVGFKGLFGTRDTLRGCKMRLTLLIESETLDDSNIHLAITTQNGDLGPTAEGIYLPDPSLGVLTRETYDIDEYLSRKTFYDDYTGNVGIILLMSVGPTSDMLTDTFHVKMQIELLDSDDDIFNKPVASGVLDIDMENLKGFSPSDYTLMADYDALTARVDGLSGTILEYITAWGDSLTAGGGWTTRIAELSGLPVYNGGTGGESSKTIAARQGGDVMMLNNVTIPATTTPVTVATKADGGIPTQLGEMATPLLQGGAHVNPCYLGDVKGTLVYTGSDYADPDGTWTFTRESSGNEVIINRPTALRTDFDINRNASYMILFVGANGGYASNDALVELHKKMIAHHKGSMDKVLIVGFSKSGCTEASMLDYETTMRNAFGRRFVSVRKYLSTPIYSNDVIVSSYGLDDAGITPTAEDLVQVAVGSVPPSLRVDSVHYNTACKTVLGDMFYKRMVELNMFQ